MQNLSLTLIQADLIWEDATANLQKFETLFASINEPTDIILLPEMFTTGFSMSPKPLAELFPGPSTDWMQRQAKKYDAAIVGSLIIKENDQFFNRLIWVMPDGEILLHYNKRHLFSLAGEHFEYTAGDKQLLVDFKGWKIMPLICYDLRFPAWSRNTTDYDLLIYIANFPDRRSFAWRNLLRARAIENQSYTIGLNRVGIDGNEIYYGGDSCVLDYAGHAISLLPAKEMVQTITINHEAQKAFRKKLAFLDDRDAFQFLD